MLLLTTAPAFAQRQLTAYAALKIVSKQVSPVALNRVISVKGIDGDPQPVKWNIVVVDRRSPSGVREIQVGEGRVIAQGPGEGVAVAASQPTLPTSKLNLDSSGAFEIANHTADTAHLNFAFIAYTLRTNDRGLPVWIVSLQDENRRSLGAIHINASKGGIMRVEGVYRGANLANVEQAPPERGGVHRPGRPPREIVPSGGEDEVEVQSGHGEEDAGSEDENIVKAELKRLFRHTRDEGQRVFFRFRSSFQDFMRR